MGVLRQVFTQFAYYRPPKESVYNELEWLEKCSGDMTEMQKILGKCF